MEVTQLHTLNLTNVLSESKRIILSSYTHFLTLSLLFVPLSFSLITTTLNQPFTDHPSNHKIHATNYLLYTLTINILAICAIGTVIYSTHHAFLGKPVKFSDALKSLVFSFFPLASTAIAAYVLIVLISISFILCIATVLMLAQYVGFVIDYHSVYFLAIMGATLIAIIIYFQVNWSLALVVVVVESKWGFAPLKRSSFLVKGMRTVSLLVKVCLGVGVVIVGILSAYVHVASVTMLGSVFVTMFLLWSTAATTVLYNYCKALHGEVELEVGEGFGHHECMDLLSDGEKVPQVVVVVAA